MTFLNDVLCHVVETPIFERLLRNRQLWLEGGQYTIRLVLDELGESARNSFSLVHYELEN